MVESHFRHFLGGILERMFMFPFSRIDNGWLLNWKQRIYGYWQGVVSKLSLPKSVRRTNVGPYALQGKSQEGLLELLRYSYSEVSPVMV
jgi:hypothetical protein